MKMGGSLLKNNQEFQDNCSKVIGHMKGLFKSVMQLYKWHALSIENEQKMEVCKVTEEKDSFI